MKRLFYGLTVAFLAGTQLFAASRMVEKVVEFMDEIESQRDAWMRYQQDKTIAKIDLKRKHKRELFELHKQLIKDMTYQSEDGGMLLEDFLRAAYRAHVDLFRRQLDEWREFGARYREKAQELANKHQERLDDFAEEL